MSDLSKTPQFSNKKNIKLISNSDILDTLDAKTIYDLLCLSKDTLDLLNDKFFDFPMSVWLDGTSALEKAMAYVDEKLILPYQQ